MKKLISLMGISLLATSATVVTVACGKRDNELRVVFVPSQNQTEVESTTASLERLLTESLKEKASKRGAKFDKKVKVTTSQNYEIAGQSLANGNEDIGFLPINTYSAYRGEKQNDGTYSKLGVLLTAGRSGVTPETTLKDFEKDGKFNNEKATTQINDETSFNLIKNYKDSVAKAKPNADKDGYSKGIYDAANPANYYRSYVFANIPILKSINIDNNSNNEWKGKNFYDAIESLLKDGNKNGNVKKYKDLLKMLFQNPKVKIGIGKSKTSSSGFLYPVLWLKDFVGLSETEITKMLTEKDTNRRFVKALSFTDSATTIGSKDAKAESSKYAITFGFSDIRFRDRQTDGKDQGKVKEERQKEKELFDNSLVIGASQSIYNDGISYSKSSKSVFKDKQLLDDVRQSFVDIIEKNDEAKKIFKIYNHERYIVPGSKIDEEISKSNTNIEAIKKLVKDINW
ncbi:Vmc-like lipoprotein signal peptide domain-containing protein [Mycoplasma mycoides]|uniref:Vmc-like lipoprotein signal peptide domain-containing protein n=1 Tax=Mycoplasma mycoides TaxID=2102 RepID=UPI002736F866|nr:phosphonate ABC transporter substrate-binding protein [Mycoplasma mycoides]MDP4040831.1 phosphonate ABC transporter substrate-binding protein [Mycoplasma mycoides]MDP4041692.1 phosphonate ABC transporter substrate-binding protein [Mycoplasma mycoides]MDP4042586.1 phosphonate ABC transporter substrate-binding protein [Mycoplasma mycoides]MDP4044060.1 phosphonate ABC transporter substrate-binding protein [Mycoplasma mycoides]MDP4044931.1 phosphonate ABC transporter substrate-binding protein [